MPPQVNPQRFALGPAASAVETELHSWATGGKIARLWKKDNTLWTSADESQWLGWMGAVEAAQARIAEYQAIAADARDAGFEHVVVLGMGGSSLCPDVFRATFGRVPGAPQLHVVDSVVPAQVLHAASRLDLQKSLFLVASKSGSTIEPNVLKQFFYDRVAELVGTEHAGRHFVAITDPGTKMQAIAEADGFRRIVYGDPTIGGRYSALSPFGMTPASAMGMDLERFLASTAAMVQACHAESVDNPGVALGVALGILTRAGRDKVTLISSPGIGSLGAWLEQLLAESLGKEGKGLIPVAEEPLGPPEVYGNDRVFAYSRLETAPSAEQDRAIEALEKAGHPVIRFQVADIYDLGQEFFRWEIATAVVGAVLNINPFNQPDVEAAKIAARKVTAEYEQTGKLPATSPLLEQGGLAYYADENNASRLLTGDLSARSILAQLLGQVHAGDYFAINAYLEMNPDNIAALERLRTLVRDTRKVATTVGFGPRFLHSTGQLHKGGPNTGVFLQLTCDDPRDLPIAGQKYTFGVLKMAQSQGDLQVLADRGRRLLRVHLGADVAAGLEQLQRLVGEAL